MKPNKAAMEKALDKYYSMLDEPGWDDEEIIERVLQVAYDAQFGDETLYRKVEWKGHVRWEPIGDDDE